MGSIYKRGKVYYIDVRAGGKRVRKRIGSSRKIAEMALKDAEVKIARNEFGFADNQIRVDRFLEQFLDYSRANHQPATTNRYRAVIEHFQSFLRIKCPEIGLLSQITSETMDKYKVWRRDAWVNPNGDPVESDDDVTEHTRKGARAHTVNFEIGALKTVLNLAIKWGYLRENPTKVVKKLKVNDSKPERFLSKEEVTRLLNACPSDLYPIYYTFLQTGMRKAELENLRWEDVDLGRKRIRVTHRDDWKPKAGDREIPISKGLHTLLTDLKAKNDTGLKSIYAFPDPTTGKKIKTKLREKLIRIASEAGIPDLTRVHTLRHTFASHLVMSGIDLPTVQKLMGHADIQSTMKYAHLASEHLTEAVDRLDYGG